MCDEEPALGAGARSTATIQQVAEAAANLWRCASEPLNCCAAADGAGNQDEHESANANTNKLV
jgi:hypothetical protein